MNFVQILLKAEEQILIPNKFGLKLFDFVGDLSLAKQKGKEGKKDMPEFIID